MLCAKVLNARSTDSISAMIALANVTVGADVVLRYPPPCPADEYISRYVPRLDALWFAIMPVDQVLTVKVSS